MFILHILELKPFFYYFTIPRHWIWVTRNRKECSYENIHPENISRVLWVRDNYTIKDGRKIIVSIIHTGRARAILYYFVIPRHWIWVIRNEKYCSSTNIHEQNKTKDLPLALMLNVQFLVSCAGYWQQFNAEKPRIS